MVFICYGKSLLILNLSVKEIGWFLWCQPWSHIQFTLFGLGVFAVILVRRNNMLAVWQTQKSNND